MLVFLARGNKELALYLVRVLATFLSHDDQTLIIIIFTNSIVDPISNHA